MAYIMTLENAHQVGKHQNGPRYPKYTLQVVDHSGWLIFFFSIFTSQKVSCLEIYSYNHKNVF